MEATGLLKSTTCVYWELCVCAGWVLLLWVRNVSYYICLHVPDYNGRYTVPILWDKQNNTIVNNESSEIIRMFNTEFNQFCPTEEQRSLNFYPEELQKQIDAVNEWIYPLVVSVYDHCYLWKHIAITWCLFMPCTYHCCDLLLLLWTFQFWCYEF